MKGTKKQIIAVLLTLALTVGIVPQIGSPVTVEAASSSVTLDNLGNKGSVSVGSKTKSGICFISVGKYLLSGRLWGKG